MHAASIPSWVGPVPHETMERLRAYAALLLKWNAAINLVGKTTERDLWQRHIWDSYQLVPLVPHGTLSLADLGSGGGLPGIVLAGALPETCAITMVERDMRKASFLREAVRSLGLKHATVIHGDVTELQQRFAVITSRALASLDLLCSFAHPLREEGAICLFPKGEQYATEIAQARANWSFDHRVIPSKTNEKAGIVSISQLCPA
ncbi:MAG: 16S rRNA (guanine(527)-N(7))-methyltransferase RsmG [Azospirillum brasilense]|nr:MAG: 16S rRNA (guanine(527)-N(7))-methyltransferase RsmG [Azospirillum brasilense]